MDKNNENRGIRRQIDSIGRFENNSRINVNVLKIKSFMLNKLNRLVMTIDLLNLEKNNSIYELLNELEKSYIKMEIKTFDALLSDVVLYLSSYYTTNKELFRLLISDPLYNSLEVKRNNDVIDNITSTLISLEINKLYSIIPKTKEYKQKSMNEYYSKIKKLDLK